MLGSDEVGSKSFSKRLYGAGSGGGWSLEVVPLYLWSSKTDCGQASAWSLALNLSEQATKGRTFPTDTVQYCCAGGEYDKTRNPGSDW